MGRYPLSGRHQTFSWLLRSSLAHQRWRNCSLTRTKIALCVSSAAEAPNVKADAGFLCRANGTADPVW